MKSLSKNYLVAVGITWGLTVLLTASGYLLFIGPQSKAVKQVREELLSYQQQYSNANETRNEQVKLELQKKLQTAQALKNSLISSSANIAPLTFQISQVGSKLKINELTSKRNDSLSHEVIEGCENIGEIWIDLKFAADFPKFAMFINTLERHSPFIFIESFDISRKENSSLTPEVKMGMSFFIGKELAQNIP